MECRTYSENLSALIDGELSSPERESLSEHLKICQACQAEYDSLLYAFQAVERFAEDPLQAPAWGPILDRISAPKASWGDLRWLFQPRWAGGLAVLLLALSVPIYWNSAHQRAVLEQQLAVYVHQRDETEAIHRGIIKAEPVGWVTHNPFRKLVSETGNPFSVE